MWIAHPIGVRVSHALVSIIHGGVLIKGTPSPVTAFRFNACTLPGAPSTMSALEAL